MSRLVLQPPYMEDSPAWAELIAAIDNVLKSRVDDPTIHLSKIRDNWMLDEAATNLIAQGSMLDQSDFMQYDRDLLVRKANMVGFSLLEADLLSDEDYLRMSRHLALFWYGKGTSKFCDFLGFVLNSVLRITYMWSQVNPSDETAYGPIVPEGDPSIGTPVWEGGTWFPTTHVRLSYDPTHFANYSLSKLTALFYAIANYNLVIDSVVLESTNWIHSIDNDKIANIVVVYPLIVQRLTVSAS